MLVHAVPTGATTHLLKAKIFQYLSDLACSICFAKGGGNLSSQRQEFGVLRDFIALLTVVTVKIEFLDALDGPPPMVGVVEQTTGEDTAHTRSLKGGCVGCNGSEDAKSDDDRGRVVGIAMEPQHILAEQPVNNGEDDVVAQHVHAEPAEDARASIANKGRQFLDAHLESAAGGGLNPSPRGDNDTDGPGEGLDVLEESTHGTTVAQELDQLQRELSSLVAVEVYAGEGVSLVNGGTPVEAGHKVESSQTDQKTRGLPPVTEFVEPTKVERSVTALAGVRSDGWHRLDAGVGMWIFHGHGARRQRSAVDERYERRRGWDELPRCQRGATLPTE